jgi:tellurite resistance protein TerC
VIGITQDTFLLYTSNICAVLGLRSLFFIVASMMDKFHYLKVALALILAFVGLKMLVGYVSGFFLEHAFHVPVGVSLGVIASLLVGSIVLSLIFPKKDGAPPTAV